MVRLSEEVQNYIVLEDENDNLHKAWIYDCI